MYAAFVVTTGEERLAAGGRRAGTVGGAGAGAAGLSVSLRCGGGGGVEAVPDGQERLLEVVDAIEGRLDGPARRGKTGRETVAGRRSKPRSMRPRTVSIGFSRRSTRSGRPISDGCNSAPSIRLSTGTWPILSCWAASISWHVAMSRSWSPSVLGQSAGVLSASGSRCTRSTRSRWAGHREEWASVVVRVRP